MAKERKWFVDHYEDVTTIKESYGHYRLEITYRKNFASVKVEDLSALKFPLVFSTPMSYGEANVYLEMFKKFGYIPVVDVEFSEEPKKDAFMHQESR